MTKKVPKKILRIERHFFVNLRKKLFLAAPAAPRRRRRQFFWPGGAPPPPTEIDRRAAADTMTSAHSSNCTIGLRSFRRFEIRDAASTATTCSLRNVTFHY